MTHHRYAPLVTDAAEVQFDFSEADRLNLVGVDRFRQAADVIYHEAMAIMLAKRDQRGTENISEQGLSGVLSRLASDKGARLRLAARQVYGWEALADEGELELAIARLSAQDVDGIVDDLLDSINYAIIALALLHGRWADGE